MTDPTELDDQKTYDQRMVAEAVKRVDSLGLNVAVDMLCVIVTRAVTECGGGLKADAYNVQIAYSHGWWKLTLDIEDTRNGDVCDYSTIGRELGSVALQALDELGDWMDEAQRQFEKSEGA